MFYNIAQRQVLTLALNWDYRKIIKIRKIEMLKFIFRNIKGKK